MGFLHAKKRKGWAVIKISMLIVGGLKDGRALLFDYEYSPFTNFVYEKDLRNCGVDLCRMECHG